MKYNVSAVNLSHPEIIFLYAYNATLCTFIETFNRQKSARIGLPPAAIAATFVLQH